MSSSEGYLKRGLRQIGHVLPVKLIVEFDRRVNEKPFRSRTSMVEEAIRHFLVCPNANWEAGDHPKIEIS
jgi:metal-responsive CopG/Arc/MetJ family transcriptional regulator